MIQLQRHDSYIDLLGTSQFPELDLSIESQVKELPLYDLKIDESSSGQAVAQAFKSNSLLPGVIIIEKGEFLGLISQRQFFELMSRPYGLELFSRRSISCLYRFVNQGVFKISGELPIVEAARRALQRSNHLVYEPIVIEIEPSVYRLLSMHQLMLADSQIHQATCILLNEKMNKQAKNFYHEIEELASLNSSEKNTISQDISVNIASEIKSPVYWNQIFNFLFVYCKSMKQVLSNYEKLVPQDEINRDLMFKEFPETLKIMLTNSTRLTKYITALQILLKRLD